MPNAYADLTTFKSRGVLNITSTGFDTRLRELLEAVSRLIDRYCNRHFYVLVATNKLDGDGGTELIVQDLISVITLQTDDDKDRTFETTWAATDYLLYPSNAAPSKEWGSPYTRILVDTEAGSEDVFTKGMQTVQIVGKWGYREVTEDSGTDVNNASGYTATDTSLVVDDGSKFGIAQTILIGSEQLYITNIATNTLTVTRGVNGTTAATIADNADINLYRYPDPIVQACLAQASLLWYRRIAAFHPASAQAGSDNSFGAFERLNPDVRQLLSAYRKLPVGLGLS